MCKDLTLAKTFLFRHILLPKCPSAQTTMMWKNTHAKMFSCWNVGYVLVSKSPCDEMSMPKCLLPKCQVPKWWEAKFLQPNRNRFCQHLNSSGENFFSVFSKWNFFNMIFPKTNLFSLMVLDRLIWPGVCLLKPRNGRCWRIHAQQRNWKNKIHNAI